MPLYMYMWTNKTRSAPLAEDAASQLRYHTRTISHDMQSNATTIWYLRRETLLTAEARARPRLPVHSVFLPKPSMRGFLQAAEGHSDFQSSVMICPPTSTLSCLSFSRH